MRKRRRDTPPAPAPARASAAPPVPVSKIATAAEIAARLATLTIVERELWEWGTKQEPLNIGLCVRGPYIIDVDFHLSLFSVQQHIQQCLDDPDRKKTGTEPVSCTHGGPGAPFPSRLNALLADLPGPDGNSWTARALASAITDQGVAVPPSFLISLSDGRRIHPGPVVLAATARVLAVPESYFQGRAVRLRIDPATGQQRITEELYDAAGQPNPYPAPALHL